MRPLTACVCTRARRCAFGHRPLDLVLYLAKLTLSCLRPSTLLSPTRRPHLLYPTRSSRGRLRRAPASQGQPSAGRQRAPQDFVSPPSHPSLLFAHPAARGCLRTCVRLVADPSLVYPSSLCLLCTLMCVRDRVSQIGTRPMSDSCETVLPETLPSETIPAAVT